MVIRIFQLNMFRGKFIREIIEYVKKENFDIIHLQEATNGKISFGGVSCFEILTKSLQAAYKGEFVTIWQAEEDPNASFCNATFYKNKFQLLKKKIIWLKSFRKIVNFEKRNIEEDPHCVLGLYISDGTKTFWSLNTHLAWSPTSKDTPKKISQGKILFDFVKNIKEPFILSGDFNVDSSSKIVSSLTNCANDLVSQHNITNTLNPRIHYAKQLFPKGVAVDFIFTSKDLKGEEFRVIEDPDLSDHFGLCVTVNI